MTNLRDDPRNVIDYYAYWKEDAIKADLRSKCNNFSVLVQNLIHDFNLGSIIRCANAFCAKEVIIYGSKQYDKRGTVGAHQREAGAASHWQRETRRATACTCSSWWPSSTGPGRCSNP